MSQNCLFAHKSHTWNASLICHDNRSSSNNGKTTSSYKSCKFPWVRRRVQRRFKVHRASSCNTTQRGPLNVVFVSTEVAPWSKVGGLGDVLAALPEKLAERGHRVMTVAPRYEDYKGVKDTKKFVNLITVKPGNQRIQDEENSNSNCCCARSKQTQSQISKVKFYMTTLNGVDRVFIDSPLYKEAGLSGMYSPYNGMNYVSDSAYMNRLGVLNQAAIFAPLVLWDNCDSSSYSSLVFVVNDWPCCLLPLYLKVHGGSNEEAMDNVDNYEILNNDLRQLLEINKQINAKVVLALHNGAHKGPCIPVDNFNCPGIHNDKLLDWILGKADQVIDLQSERIEDYIVEWWRDLKLERHRQAYKLCWLQAGMMAADDVVTVSPTYAKEIARPGTQGEQIWQLLRGLNGEVGVKGILNGTDTKIWNPTIDNYIPFQYSKQTLSLGKAIAKTELQKCMGLKVRDDIPLIGFIGRLDQQKGVDAMISALYGSFSPQIPQRVCLDLQQLQLQSQQQFQVCFLGSGDQTLQNAIQNLQYAFPGYATGYVGFSEQLAHLILAASDFIMIPSLFEPCGLVALHAQAYGTIPIVGETGGLIDIVQEGITGHLLGKLQQNCFLQNVRYIVDGYRYCVESFNSQRFRQMQQNCINTDVSWDEPAAKWEAVLQQQFIKA
eukprot:TRINITY_DN6562_c0_g2_i2.p1 TRINITY_DN6562_c0_g2~~TRINITY_DN6562_c0_g2_i2.p1  ORF type:complete len:662 (-),score=68.72 TRINITY_DN6562_c0_g2_i2:392-2377(-)